LGVWVALPEKGARPKQKISIKILKNKNNSFIITKESKVVQKYILNSPLHKGI
jgi:hypothetical protein